MFLISSCSSTTILQFVTLDQFSKGASKLSFGRGRLPFVTYFYIFFPATFFPFGYSFFSYPKAYKASGASFLRSPEAGASFLGGSFLGGSFLGGSFLGGSFFGGSFLGGSFLDSPSAGFSTDTYYPSLSNINAFPNRSIIGIC